MDLVWRLAKVLVEAACGSEVDGAVECEIGECILALPCLLQELNGLKQKTLLFHSVCLRHGKCHVQHGILIRILIVFSLEDLLVGKDLRLRWRHLSSFLKRLLQVLEGSLVLGERLAFGQAHLLAELSRKVLRHVAWSIFGKIDALGLEQVLRLPFDDVELLA